MSRDHEQEPNLYETRMRGWLAEYPYPLPTRDPSSPFTSEEIARAMAEAYAAQKASPNVDDDYYSGGGETEFVIVVPGYTTRSCS